MCDAPQAVEVAPVNTDGGTERDLFYFPAGIDRSHIDMVDRLTECLAWIEEGHCWILSREGGGGTWLRLRRAQRRIMHEMMMQAATCPRCGQQRYGYGPQFWTCKPCSTEKGEPVYRGVPIRILIVKARKEGVTTLSMAIQVFFVQHYPYQGALMVTHSDESTKKIFEGALRMHTRGASDGMLDRLPKMIREPHASTFRAFTGKGAFVGSGENNTIVHISEYGKIKGKQGKSFVDKELMASIKESLAMLPHTIMIIESTGMGRDGDFYRRCEQARREQLLGRTVHEEGFRLLFFPWFEDEDYSLDLPIGFKPQPHEATMRDQVEREYGVRLTDEQLYWWRRKRDEEQIDGHGGVGEATFRREYPTFFDDCFSVAEGRVYPNFTMSSRHMRKIDLGPWYRLIDAAPKDHLGRITSWDHAGPRGIFRGMDVGYAGDHLWVIVFGVYDNTRPPEFTINPADPGCMSLANELMGYVFDAFGRPEKDKSDHGPDATRYPVTHLKMCGQVHIFKALYYKDAAELPNGAMETIARDIYEASGWVMPDGADPKRIDLYQPGAGALQFSDDICDPRAAAELDQFGRWGLPFIAADTRPPKSHITNRTVDKEKNWGISRLAKLINGTAFFDGTDDRVTDEELARQAMAAQRGIGTPLGRPSAPTAEQRAALERIAWSDGGMF